MISSLTFSGADLIVEVSHPDVTVKYGERFLRAADYLVCITNNVVTNVQRIDTELKMNR